MRRGRGLVGLQVSSTAVMGKNDKLREEVLNTIVRQVKELRADWCDVFICVPQIMRYCCNPQWTEEIRVAFGKMRLLREYTRVFARKGLQTCPADNFNRRNSQRVIKEAFALDMVPIISGSTHVSAEVEHGNFCLSHDDVYFALVCSVLKVDMAVIVADSAEVDMKKEKVGKLFPETIEAKMTVYYRRDFLLEAVDPVSYPAYAIR